LTGSEGVAIILIMEQKQRLFIYDRREVVILISLGLMVAAFAFTLGVHLGKRVTTQVQTPTVAEVPRTATLQDGLPNRQELTEQSQNAVAAADDELSQSLHQEVQKTGIRLKTVRQIDLPVQTKSTAAGATTMQPEQAAAAAASRDRPSAASTSAPVSAPMSARDAAIEEENTAAKGKFTLQIGSFPSAEEAKTKMDALRIEGARPFVRSADVKGIGKRFRLFIGDFSSREEADKAGRRYQSQRMIDSYLVSRLEEPKNEQQDE
jgi:cell division septation protein DedD